MCSAASCAVQSPLIALCCHTAPQPEGEASVTTTSRREGIEPNEMPLARYAPALHGRNARRHRLDTLTLLDLWDFGSNWRQLIQIWNGRKYRRPSGTTDVTDVNIPNSLRNRLYLNLLFFRNRRRSWSMAFTRLGVGKASIWRESRVKPMNTTLWLGMRQLLAWLTVRPNLVTWCRRDAVSRSACSLVRAQISQSSRYGRISIPLACIGASAALMHLVKTRGARERPNGSTLNWKALPSNAKRRYCLWGSAIGTWKYASFKSMDVNQLCRVTFWSTSAVLSMWKGNTFRNVFSPRKSSIGRNPPSFFGIRK